MAVTYSSRSNDALPHRLAQIDIADWPRGRLPLLVVQTGFGLLCSTVVILARTGIDIFSPTAGPFALIYPATLIATLFGRWQAGLVTGVSSFLWAWFFILPRTAAGLPLGGDISRAIVNSLSVVVVLTFAEIFRQAVHRLESDAKAKNVELENEVARKAKEALLTWNVSPDLLGALNSDGFFENSNPAWFSLLGWTSMEVAATPVLDFLHPDDVERTQAGFKLTQIGQPAIRFPNRYRHKNGTYRWVSWVGVPEGGLVYCTGRDITDEKAAEEQLAQAQEALRHAQKMEAIGQLTGGVAHDFNNLLTVIRGSVELLQRPDLSEERRLRFTNAIAETAGRATQLTSQLLAFARRQALRPELFDVEESLRGVMVVVRSLTGSRIVIDSQAADCPCFVMADRSQFDTAIVNLAVNARDAMNGEGRISISTSMTNEVPAIGSQPAIAGEFVSVALSDTGQGIAAEDFERIFEPFYTTKEVGAGTGLGLSQVIGFAKQSGGEIRVASRLGHGTTFTLYLPKAAEDAERARLEDSRELATSGDGVCVLVVEDNEQVGDFATSALRELGYESVLAINAEEALAKLTEGSLRFDVVFSDVVMPGMSGIDLAQEIRKLYADVPVVLTSGYSHVLAQNGTFGFELLHKPYSIEQLSLVIRKVLSWQAGVRAGYKPQA